MAADDSTHVASKAIDKNDYEKLRKAISEACKDVGDAIDS